MTLAGSLQAPAGAMLRIRRIFDLALPVDREAMRQVLEILRARLPGVSEESAAALSRRLEDPSPARRVGIARSD